MKTPPRLYAVRAGIDPAAAAVVDAHLEESGETGWAVQEDIIRRTAALWGTFRDKAEARAAWAALQAAIPALKDARATVRLLPDRDWRDSYKAHFKAWRFGRLHWVPVWERRTFRLPPGHAALWLDPGLAFGTGNHETTRLCVERLVALSQPASDKRTPYEKSAIRSVLDCGCGSGILALSAALLGFRRIAAFDNDPEAIRVSRSNAALNKLTRRVKFFTADVARGCAGRQADVVLANIQADVLMANAGHLLSAVAPGGTLVLSGILAQEIVIVRSTFARLAPEWNMRSRKLGQWADLVLNSR